MNAGAAYLFEYSNGIWSEQAYLTASNPGTYDNFGQSIDIHGSNIVVGAYGEASSNTDPNDDSAPSAGATYIFGPPNRAPYADAGADHSVNTNTPTILDASGSSDPDNDLLFYEWSQINGPSVEINSTDTITTTIIMPDDPTILTFMLTGTDTSNAVMTDTISITVQNQAPIAHAGAEQIVKTGTLVTLNGTNSSDPDGDNPLSYEWIQISGINVTLSDLNSASPTFMAPLKKSTLTFQVTVTDSLGESSTDTVAITVRETPFTIYLPTIQR